MKFNILGIKWLNPLICKALAWIVIKHINLPSFWLNQLFFIHYSEFFLTFQLSRSRPSNGNSKGYLTSRPKINFSKLERWTKPTTSTQQRRTETTTQLFTQRQMRAHCRARRRATTTTIISRLRTQATTLVLTQTAWNIPLVSRLSRRWRGTKIPSWREFFIGNFL